MQLLHCSLNCLMHIWWTWTIPVTLYRCAAAQRPITLSDNKLHVKDVIHKLNRHVGSTSTVYRPTKQIGQKNKPKVKHERWLTQDTQRTNNVGQHNDKFPSEVLLGAELIGHRYARSSLTVKYEADYTFRTSVYADYCGTCSAGSSIHLQLPLPRGGAHRLRTAAMTSQTPARSACHPATTLLKMRMLKVKRLQWS